jgi:class 3 adenylate cyclase
MGRRADPENQASKGSDSAELPQGILTFLLTDIEASTPLWERHGASMGVALARHQALIARTVAAYSGRLIKRQGEGTRRSRSSSGQATRWPRP